MPTEILTLGHSTRSLEEFLALLHEHRVELLADVRRFPASRRHPHFAREALSAVLGMQPGWTAALRFCAGAIR